MDENTDGRLGHFRWCPTQSARGKGRCWCEAAVYAAMAIIGGMTAAFEFWGAHVAEAVSPKTDALHGANDTIGDLLAVCIAFFVAYAVRATTAKKVRHYGAYGQIALLALAAALVAKEIAEKILAPHLPDAPVMIAVGIVAVLGGRARLFVLHLYRGKLTSTWRNQHRHTRSDFYYSIGVVIAGTLTFATGWAWWDVGAATTKIGRAHV